MTDIREFMTGWFEPGKPHMTAWSKRQKEGLRGTATGKRRGLSFLRVTPAPVAVSPAAAGTPAVTAVQTVRVTIPLRISDLKYWDTASNSWKIESGPVKVMVGSSSADLPISDTFTVQ